MPLPPLAHTPEVSLGLMDATPDALVVVDPSGLVRLANARAEALFGVPRAELIGSRVDQHVPGAFARIGGPSTPWSRGEVTRLTAVAVRRDGRELAVEIGIAPVRTANGVLACASIREASGLAAVAHVSDRLRDELIATVSHELRTPLTSILGYTEILVDMGEPAVSEQAGRLLEIVKRNAERQMHLVEDMLTMAILGGSGIRVAPVPTDVGLLVQRVVADLASYAAEADVALVPSGLGSLVVKGDPDRLTDVIGNLVTNAVKFSLPGDQVEVRTYAEDGHGVIEVQDHGSGFDADEVPRAFDPTYRAPGASRGEVPHAGLGLPIVKGIVDAHAGEIGLDSEPGRGTTVRVRLPLADG